MAAIFQKTIDIGHCAGVFVRVVVGYGFFQTCKMAVPVFGSTSRPGVVERYLAIQEIKESLDVEVADTAGTAVGSEGCGEKRYAGRWFGGFGLRRVEEENVHGVFGRRESWSVLMHVICRIRRECQRCTVGRSRCHERKSIRKTTIGSIRKREAQAECAGTSCEKGAKGRWNVFSYRASLTF